MYICCCSLPTFLCIVSRTVITIGQANGQSAYYSDDYYSIIQPHCIGNKAVIKKRGIDMRQAMY